jgi:hypothetical protein
MPEQMRSYGTARGIFSFLEFVGWSVVVIGIIVGLIMAESAGRYVSDGQKFMLFLMGASSSLVGLFMVGAVQNWRAGVDSAEYGQQMLKISRDQLEVSRQSLKRQEADHASFAVLRSTEDQTHKASFDQAKPTAPRQPTPREEIEPATYRGEQIRWFSGAYRALGVSFATYEEAQRAVDEKLDAPAIEGKPELSASIILGTELSSGVGKQAVPEERPSEECEGSSLRRYAEAENSVKSSESSVATEMGRDLGDEGVKEETSEPAPVMNAEPEPAPEPQDPISKIKEEAGRFFYGRMEFSSREAAEKYVRQLGVNPNLRS